MLGGIGGFAGLFDASALAGVPRPLLATTTDGVGTKVAIAQALDVHDTIGLDLVGMVVDDIVVCGAEPLFMTDYIACGKVVPERIAAIVSGIAEACVRRGLRPGRRRDRRAPRAAGAATSTTSPAPPPAWSRATDVLGPDRVRGRRRRRRDGVLGGCTPTATRWCARCSPRAGWALDRDVPELGRTLGEELLEPTRVYAARLLALIRADGVDVHALSHVTGGGLAANLARVLPPRRCRPASTARPGRPPPIFELVGELGRVPRGRPRAHAEHRRRHGGHGPRGPGGARGREAAARGLPAWVLGEVSDLSTAAVADGVEVVHGAKGVNGGSVQVVGTHPRA